jgi:hypothetical protein
LEMLNEQKFLEGSSTTKCCTKQKDLTLSLNRFQLLSNRNL